MQTEIHRFLCAHAPNTSSECSFFMARAGDVLERAPSRVSIVLKGDSSPHIGNDWETWGEMMLDVFRSPDLIPNGEMLLDLCASHLLPITTTMFKDKRACTWYQSSLDQKSMVDFVDV